jgi:hypothetical protein
MQATLIVADNSGGSDNNIQLLSSYSLRLAASVLAVSIPPNLPWALLERAGVEVGLEELPN